MLDKSIPYMDIIMSAKQEALADIKIPSLPEEFHFRMYEKGDEIGWADLEVSVKEFSSREEALSYFHKVFSPHADLLSKRMCFIVDQNDQIAATASAWFKEENGRRFPLVHWVSVSPNVQGKGLGSAIVKYVLSLFQDLEPDGKEVFLHTQTWSHKAIYMYYKYGFRITKTPLLDARTDFRYQKVLEGILPDHILMDITETTEERRSKN